MNRSLLSPMRAAILAAVLLGSPAAAHAQSAADVTASRELFKEGSALGQKGDWEGARKAYTRALELKRAAITMYSLGVAEKNTGHLLDALEHFRAFLAEPSNAVNQPYEQPARDAIVELDKRIARLAITVEPAGLDVHVAVDGAEIPKSAMDRPRAVDPGTHEVTATAKGYLPAKQSASVGEGKSAAVALKLEPAPAEAAPPPVAGTAPPSAPTRLDPPNRTLPIALFGGGGALLVGGVVVGMLGVSQASSAPTKDGPDASGAKTKALVGDILGGAGIVAAAIGVVLYVTAKPKKHEAAMSLSPWASGNVGGIGFRY